MYIYIYIYIHTYIYMTDLVVALETVLGKMGVI